MSTRVRQLANLFPTQMGPLVMRMERLAEAAHKDEKVADVYDRICESWYLSNEDNNLRAMTVFQLDIIHAEQAAGFR